MFQWLVHHFQIPHCLSCLFKLFICVSGGMIDWIVVKIFLTLSLIWTLSFRQGEMYVHYCNWKCYFCTIYQVKKRTMTGLQRVKIDKYHYWLIEYKIMKKKKIELTSGWYNNFESKIAFNSDICFIHR